MITVCIIDGYSMLLTALEALLDGQDDIKVLGTATDEQSAGSLIKLKKPEIILLDISLSDDDSFDLIHQFKKISPGSKVLILATRENVEYLRTCFNLGASGFLVKKAMNFDLIYAIRTVARGEIYIYPSLIKKFLADDKKSVIDSNIQSNNSREKFLWESLSLMEKEVMIEIANGFTNKEVAERHLLEEKIIAAHRVIAMKKLDLKKKSDITELILSKLKITGK